MCLGVEVFEAEPPDRRRFQEAKRILVLGPRQSKQVDERGES